jgi:hypothetical protein
LKTDERVLARITDGIYRQPASALRELIFNAYDADARNVWITTDAPRFSQMVVADDGHGMSLEVLNHLVHHIGGSAKRTGLGAELKITASQSSQLSPEGRKLIGKIGIGLFAVAQLTREFRIITKQKGEGYRYVADITLNIHSEDNLSEITSSKPAEFKTGDVEIWREPAKDKAAHGTQIVLRNLKDHSRSILQSRERWQRHREADALFDELVREPPAFHIGSVEVNKPDIQMDDHRLPWEDDDSPDEKFRKLYQAVLDQREVTTSVPTLESTFDNYLQMLWTLALAAPVDYIDGHPFDLTGHDKIRVFLLSNESKGAAKELTLKNKQRVWEAAQLPKPEKDIPFNVFVDGVQLLRPIRFRDLPSKSSARLQQPLLFVARCNLDLKSLPVDATGGSKVAFEGYFLWIPTVIPKENNGLLIRIGDASGTLFDDTFMHYEVSEQTRLRQLIAEIFVHDGLDAALNIDRESFNYSHPHHQFLTKWVHRALRQIATKHKAIGKEIHTQAREQQAEESYAKLQNILQDTLKSLPAADQAADVVFIEDTKSKEAQKKRGSGVLVFPKRVLEELPTAQRKGPKTVQRRELFQEQLKAVAQILEAYGLLQYLTYRQQEELLKAIARVFTAGEDL